MADDKTKSKDKDKTKDTDKDSKESKIIFDSGIGAFDWKGNNNNYKKSNSDTRKQITQETSSLVKCPACDGKDIPVLTIESQHIAIDYDFCEHFIGNSQNIFDLWSCSMCGYTAYRKAFGQTLSADDKEFIKKYLTDALHQEIKAEFGNLFKDLKTRPLNQKVIPTIGKIKNFVAFTEHKNDLDEKWKAYYYVKAVYALRNIVAMTPSCTSLNSAMLEISKKTERDVKVTESNKQLPYVSQFYLNYYLLILPDIKEVSKERLALHILISQCFSRLGYYTESKNHLKKASDLCTKFKEVDDIIKLIKVQNDLIDLEKTYTIKAVNSMKDALEEKLNYGDNQYPIIYLIGELSRRAEDYPTAYLFLSASKMLFPKESPIYDWADEHLQRKELKNDDYLLLTPPAYLKQIVLDNNKK